MRSECVISNYSPRLERFVGVREAATFLGIHPKTLQRFSRSGLVPAHPFGEGTRKSWRYLVSELDVWLRARCAARPNATDAATAITQPVDFSHRLR